MTLSQPHIFRIVAGAVRNAADGHPSWKLTRAMGESIAKRATGTLTAHLREALGALPSASCCGPSCSRSDRGAGAPLRTAGIAAERRPLRLLHNRLGALAGDAKRTGRSERAEAIIEALRLISEQQQTLATKR